MKIRRTKKKEEEERRKTNRKYTRKYKSHSMCECGVCSVCVCVGAHVYVPVNWVFGSIAPNQNVREYSSISGFLSRQHMRQSVPHSTCECMLCVRVSGVRCVAMCSPRFYVYTEWAHACESRTQYKMCAFILRLQCNVVRSASIFFLFFFFFSLFPFHPICPNTEWIR